MLSKKKCLFCIFLLIGFYSCLTGGTHGSIKSYRYSVPKYTLEKVVNKILATNRIIQRDTSKAYDDSTKNDYYNDGNSYITITINKNKLVNLYTFRYAGDKEFWDTSRVSYMSICYAFDRDGNGGSAGNGGVTWYKFGLRKKLISLFENEFINKIDSALEQKHINTD